LAGTEGLVMRVFGDGQNYTFSFEMADGAVYTSKVTPRVGFSTLRLPFNSFLPGRGAVDGVSLDPANATRIRVRFEPKLKQLEAVTQPGQSAFDSAGNRFRFEIDWIKALPGGIETDFILVSCAGGSRGGGRVDDANTVHSGVVPSSIDSSSEMSPRERMVSAKRRGETSLRNSGLGYTIVRPGPLEEEAGGYRALVFDQGNRIEQSISCADVADVCLKALHDSAARNKTFDVCWEYSPEDGLESYELVAHLPDKANNYLSPALATLQRNT